MSNSLPFTIAAHPGLVRGETFDEVYTIEDVNGNPIDISNARYTVYLRCRRQNTKTAPLWNLATGVVGEGEKTGIIGEARFYRTQAQTDALREEDHDIEICLDDSGAVPPTFKVWGKQLLPVHDPATGEIV